MPIFLRALSVANAVREWFTFTNEAVSWLGVTKRVAAAGVIAAAVVAPVVVAKPAPTVQQLKDARQVVQPAADIDLGECANGRCSVQYLIASEERVELAKRIDQACATTNDVSQEQCAAAARVAGAMRAVERQERMDAARRKAAEEAPPVTGLKMPWEH